MCLNEFLVTSVLLVTLALISKKPSICLGTAGGDGVVPKVSGTIATAGVGTGVGASVASTCSSAATGADVEAVLFEAEVFVLLAAAGTFASDVDIGLNVVNGIVVAGLTSDVGIGLNVVNGIAVPGRTHCTDRPPSHTGLSP